MSTILVSSNHLREAKRLFGKLSHRRCKLPLLNHVLLTAGDDGIRLAVTDPDHWLETRVSTDAFEPLRFLIPPDAIDTACQADRGSIVSFTPYGGCRSKDLGLVTRQGGIEATSVHLTLDPKEFPEKPAISGEDITVPPATLQHLEVLAACASKDATRQILNGVLFTPEDGGQLVATDGRRLACCPAVVPPQPFILPSLAVTVLRQPAFSSDLVTITRLEAKDPELQRVAFRCGHHLLIAKTITGTYPNYRQVIPAGSSEYVVIPHDRRPGVIAWLRNIGDSANTHCAVRLSWEKRGQLTLTHRDADGRSSSLQVPVEIHGKPPVIAFNPAYLADALEIGPTLCLSDELSPGICRHPGGRFCVIMPMRVTFAAGNPTGEVAGSSELAAQAAA